jgi:hypothetical protein
MKFLLIASCCVASAFAAPVTGLFNSGVDGTGTALVGGDGTVDAHWTLVSGPGVGSPVSAVTYKHPAYFADDAVSRWISVSSIGGPSAGNYVFQTTFDLTGFDPLATSVGYRCATDNALNGVTLNGGAVGGDCDGFGGFSGFSTISSGFVAGVNTLQFTVTDLGSPMGFRVEFNSSTRELEAVPEPSTILLSSGAFGALVLLRKRFRRSVNN